MKRDLDLARQLLLDIENRGTDCSVSVLRSSTECENDERIRYHLRLLIDAQLLKEIDRTTAGVPCVRLTHHGHELLELARSEGRWREAKWACQDRLGGLSLTVIRAILIRWATTGVERLRRQRHSYATRPYATRRLRYEPEGYRDRADYRAESLDVLEDRDFRPADNVRYVRVRPEIDEYCDSWRYGIDVDGDGRADIEYDASLPSHLI